jgi:hypothetical protein
MWRAVCPVLFVRGYLGPQPILNRRAHGLTIPVTISRPPIDMTVRCLAQPRKKLPDRSVRLYLIVWETCLFRTKWLFSDSFFSIGRNAVPNSTPYILCNSVCSGKYFLEVLPRFGFQKLELTGKQTTPTCRTLTAGVLAYGDLRWTYSAPSARPSFTSMPKAALEAWWSAM